MRLYAKGEKVAYIPKWKGQRELAERGEIADPVVAVIAPLTRGELKRYLRATSGEELYDVAGELFGEHVLEIKNLSIGGRRVESGRQLWEFEDAPPEVEELVFELLNAILDSSTLSEGELKK